MEYDAPTNIDALNEEIPSKEICREEGCFHLTSAKLQPHKSYSQVKFRNLSILEFISIGFPQEMTMLFQSSKQFCFNVSCVNMTASTSSSSALCTLTL